MAVSLTGCYTYLRRDKTEKLFYELILLAFVNYFSVLLLSTGIFCWSISLWGEWPDWYV
ncbi:MAG: hypothetical protein ACLVGL_07015 [Waltera sp.]